MSEAAIAEIKAHCSDPTRIESWLNANGAKYIGEDHQVDTYFSVPQGRLKLREGKVENTLIYYNRQENKGIKNSQVQFMKLEPGQVSALKQILLSVHTVLVVVDKLRKIFFIENVKFHIDQVSSLGSFVEIEAIGNKEHEFSELVKQCNEYQSLLSILDSDCIAASYSDLLIRKQQS